MLTRLRTMLLADGVLNAEDLAAADASRQTHRTDLTTELLLSLRLSEATLTRYLGRACSLPVVGPDDLQGIMPGVLSRLPLHRARQLSAVPFHEDASDLRIAVSSPLPPEERARLEAETGKAVRQYVTPEFRIQQALHLLHGAPLPPKAAALLAGPAEKFKISLAAAPPADRWAGRNWSTSEVMELFETSTNRDEILLAALSFLGGYFPRRILLTVTKGKIQGYGYQGNSAPARPIESLELKPAAGSPLALLCERDEYFSGPPHRAGLAPLYHGLGVDAPDEVLVTPIRIAGRTAMLAVCDLPAGHDRTAIPVIFGAMARMSEALQRLILVRKGSRANIPSLPEATEAPTPAAAQPLSTGEVKLGALSTAPMRKLNPAPVPVHSLPPAHYLTPDELEAVREAAEGAAARSATVPLTAVTPNRATAMLSPVPPGAPPVDEALAETGPERPSPVRTAGMPRLGATSDRARTAALRATGPSADEVPDLPSGAYATVPIPAVTQALEAQTPIQRITGILADLLEGAEGEGGISETRPQPFKTTGEIRMAAEAWMASKTAPAAGAAASASPEPVRHHDAHTHRLRGIAAEPVELDIELAITQSEPRAVDVDALLAGSTRERTTTALLDTLEGNDALLARAALQELLSRAKAAAPDVIARFPGVRKLDRRIPEQALRPLEEHGGLLWLTALQPATYAPMLLPLMRSDKDDTRYYATLIVAREGSDEFIPDIVERLFDRDDQIRSIALRFIESVRGSRPMAAQVPGIRLRLKEGDDHSRGAAISALMLLRDELCIPALIDLLGHAGLQERAAAALTRITFLPADLDAASWQKWHKAHGAEGRLTWLLDAMVHRDRRVRENAAKELRMTPRLTVNYHPDLDRDAQETARRAVQRFFAR